MTAQPKIVLVTEDDLLTRMGAVEIFIDAGFAVMEAGHADEALEVLNLRAADIHLLFTDINMPGDIDGLALAHHVCGAWPKIALLITSGGQHQPTKMPLGSRFLPKPYGADQVMAHVRALIAA